jgi:cytochrome c oxidase assembly protein subunit 15
LHRVTRIRDDPAVALHANVKAEQNMANSSDSGNRQIAFWLLACCTLIFLMVVVGGVTRLTHSGLSMTEWQPLIGTVPPLNANQWDEVFRGYQRTPEYLDINSGMTLEEFKGIFWWEYFHRLLGRSIGAAFLLPFLYFLVRRRLETALARRLSGIFLLGALQGGLGWYMVKSGLVEDPHVSQYRLTAHLGLAVLIYGAILWTALEQLSPARSYTGRPTHRIGLAAASIAGLIFVMALSGGMVAGTRAGYVYDTFPLMDGRWIPAGLFALDPWFLNFFENITTVQFDHRLIAWTLVLLTPLLWLRARRAQLSECGRLGWNLLLGMLVVQVSLGIGTLLLGVPVILAAAHQAGALLLFSAAIFTLHEVRRG